MGPEILTVERLHEISGQLMEDEHMRHVFEFAAKARADLDNNEGPSDTHEGLRLCARADMAADFIREFYGVDALGLFEVLYDVNNLAWCAPEYLVRGAIGD